MTSDELYRLVVASGFTARNKGREVALEVCYFCGNTKSNLELNAESGVFHCWACRRGGRLSELLQLLTGQVHNIPVQKAARATGKIDLRPPTTEFKALPIAQVASAATYLARRGIPPDVAAQYGVVVCVEQQHRLEGRLAFQLREYWSGLLAGWVGRSYTGKQPKYISTLTQKVITGWRTRDRATPAVVVEGPLDGLSVHRAGFQAAVLSGIGTAGALEWAARIDPQAPVVIMLDAEAKAEADRLYWQLQPILGERLVVVQYPEGGTQDPAQVGPDGVRALVTEALRGRGHTNWSQGPDQSPT